MLKLTQLLKEKICTNFSYSYVILIEIKFHRYLAKFCKFCLHEKFKILLVLVDLLLFVGHIYSSDHQMLYILFITNKTKLAIFKNVFQTLQLLH